MSATGTPSFRHTDSGTPESAWVDDERWRELPSLTMTAKDGRSASSLVVVAAHPDDETLGAAGLLAFAHGAGLPITVVVGTDGENSHPHATAQARSSLGGRRLAELAAAVAVSAPGTTIVHLGLPDGDLAAHAQPLADRLAELVDDRTVVCGPWRRDGHPDHEAAGRAAAQVAARAGARLLEYPIWLWHWGSPSELPWSMATRLDLTNDAVRLKKDALARHESQVEAWSDLPGEEAVLHPAMLAHFTRTWETFFDCGAVDDADSETFDAMFDGGSDDPWRVVSTWYEERKRDVCLAALPTRDLGSVLEVGCSIGVLTERLAHRADSVLGMDLSAKALAIAARRLAGRRGVRLRQGRLPQDWPAGKFDTIVLSEVCYFLQQDELVEVIRSSMESLSPRGSILVCDWRHLIVGWPLQAADVHEIACATAGLEMVSHFEDADFVLDVLRRPGLASVAELDGLT